MFSCVYLGSKNVQGGGGSIQNLEVNLLQTWFVYIESRISPKDAPQCPTYFGFCWKVKVLSI